VKAVPTINRGLNVAFACVSLFLIISCQKGPPAQPEAAVSSGSHFQSETCRFTATFPSTPNSEPPRDANGVKFRAYWASSNVATYSIACFVYPPDSKSSAMQFLERHRDETLSRADGTLISDHVTEYQGYPAREFTYTASVQGAKKVSVARTVLAGQYFYILQVLFSSTDGKQVSEKDIMDFFQSLSISPN
jgi:hypothetical protein